MDTAVPTSYHNQEQLPASLLQLLSNTIVLYQTVPYLSASTVLALGATSKSFHELIHNTPQIFRYLELSQVNAAQSRIGAIDHGGEVWRNVQLDENVTEDDFYGGPLRGIFNGLRRQAHLQDVQTLVLDGLTVPSDLFAEIITDKSFNVRILSIRGVYHLNEAKIRQALSYVIRPDRPANAPKLQGLYIFGSDDDYKPTTVMGTSWYLPGNPSHGGVLSTPGAQIGAEWNQESSDALAEARNGDKWFGKSGKILQMAPSSEWAATIQACKGIISFDAVNCMGPRHGPWGCAAETQTELPWFSETEQYVPPRVATYALEGCSGCGTAPEGLARLGLSHMERFPLLAPPPIHSSTVKAAKTPSHRTCGVDRRLLVRCSDCIQRRYCESCHKWWCEDCYEVSNQGHNWSAGGMENHEKKNVKGVIRSCFECGFNCAECVERTQLMCKVCGGGYCLIHNEGSTLTTAGRHAIHGCRC